jgi:hypothetical protein
MPEEDFIKCGLKNSKELLENSKSPFPPSNYSIKTHDSTTLSTTITLDNLKTIVFSIIDSCFFKQK